MQDDSLTLLRALHSFQSWGIIKPSGSAPAPSAGSTPASPPSAGVLLYDRAAAVFQETGLIPRAHSATNAMKSPAKNTHHAPTLDAAAPSPAKLPKGGAKATLYSPDKRGLNSGRAAGAESKVGAQRRTPPFEPLTPLFSG